MYFLTGYVLKTDNSAPFVRSFIATNERILKAVGPVQEVKIIKRVSVSATSSAGAYRLYTVDVRGATASTTVVVRINGDDGDGLASLESMFR